MWGILGTPAAGRLPAFPTSSPVSISVSPQTARPHCCPAWVLQGYCPAQGSHRPNPALTPALGNLLMSSLPTPPETLGGFLLQEKETFPPNVWCDGSFGLPSAAPASVGKLYQIVSICINLYRRGGLQSYLSYILLPHTCSPAHPLTCQGNGSLYLRISLQSSPSQRVHDPFSVWEYVLVPRRHGAEDPKVPSGVPKGLEAQTGLLLTDMSIRLHWVASNR